MENKNNKNNNVASNETSNISLNSQSTVISTKELKNVSLAQKNREKINSILKRWEVSPLEGDKILEVRNLHVSFPVGRKKTIHIVRGLDLDIHRGQIVGLVGESGSGKSVTSKTLINVNENGIITADKIQLGNLELTKIKREGHWQHIRGSKIGYIPQDPLTSLNPTRTVGKQLLDALNNNPDWKDRSFTDKKDYLINLLKTFGLRDAEKIFLSYPHTLSGGMKQRIVITMVVALKPDLIIADEPTTALDPTVQASVLALFEKIRQEMKVSIILISHNISVIVKFCDYIYVMYAGKIVERGTKKEIFTEPAHPYTWALISAIPENKDEKLYNIKGTPPDMSNLSLGDPFAPRNDYALEIDFLKEPPLIPITETHAAATWLLHPEAPKVTLSKELIKRLNAFKKVFKDDTK
ncbi:oligopeptide transport system ATP-binding protein [Metamycoplasma subdolum]|uniref:Oligopeptide transport system ATP-binding protein n=1 Tax=Metamycoplasma subdolum TaxID=92407 RepID=A0A3M0A530_9BACT|nr:ABC transporter ATP-binding protein [Metamycoplasma subdolum]RMA78609.1 oligopeptide transport system ATP-binding protein [Metamycoplasma subdolum]WPB50256.1 ABC transporter ATP-binding protein [Metamycoplasma subdolum]